MPEPLPPRIAKICSGRDLEGDVLDERHVAPANRELLDGDGGAHPSPMTWKKMVKPESMRTIAKSEATTVRRRTLPDALGASRRREPLLTRDEADRDREGDAHDQPGPDVEGGRASRRPP